MQSSIPAKARAARLASTWIAAAGKDLLQPPDRRDRGHEVTDVIDLHHQDPLDVRMAEQRVPGEHRLHRFVVRTIVVRMARQARTEIRIAGSEQRAPARLFGLGIEPGGIVITLAAYLDVVITSCALPRTHGVSRTRFEMLGLDSVGREILIAFHFHALVRFR